MPGPNRTTPPFGLPSRSDVDALWRARDEDRSEAKERFGKLEDGVNELRSDVGEVKMSLKGIEDAEKQKATSAEKWNTRKWHLFSAFLVALLVPIVIALFKVFAPIALEGSRVKPATVNDRLDDFHQSGGR